MQIEGLVISRRDEAQRLPRRSEINTFREREGQEEEARVIKQLNSGRRSGKKREEGEARPAFSPRHRPIE